MTKSSATPSQLWLEHVYDSDLSGTAKAVAAFLCSRMFHTRNSCFVSVATISQQTSYCRRTVQMAKKSLIASGWLSETWVKGRQAPTLTALTRAAHAPPQEIHPAAHAPVSEMHPPPAGDAPEAVTEAVKTLYRFKPPTVDEVKAYCDEKNFTIDPESFVDFNQSKGWMIGKNKMKDWKAAVRTWQKRNQSNGKINGHSQPSQNSRRLSAGDRVRAATQRRRAESAREIS